MRAHSPAFPNRPSVFRHRFINLISGGSLRVPDPLGCSPFLFGTCPHPAVFLPVLGAKCRPTSSGPCSHFGQITRASCCNAAHESRTVSTWSQSWSPVPEPSVDQLTSRSSLLEREWSRPRTSSSKGPLHRRKHGRRKSFPLHCSRHRNDGGGSKRRAIFLAFSLAASSG